MTPEPIAFPAACSMRASRAAACWRLVGIQAGLILALIVALNFTVEVTDFAIVITLIVGVVAVATAIRASGMRRAADAAEGAALILTSGMTTGCLTILLATTAVPFRDDSLAFMDHVLFPFLSWPAMARSIGAYPELVNAMGRVYSTLVWQPFALVLLLAALGRGAAMWRFVHAWLLALITCIAVFALVPAMTAQVHYGFAPGSIHGLAVNAGWRPAAILMDVRDGALRTLASGSMTGLVTFPSFHAAGAILLGWGFWQAGGLWRAVILLEIAMLVTVPLIGSHYFVDVLGGAVVALLCLAGVERSGASRYATSTLSTKISHASSYLNACFGPATPR